MEIGVVNFEPGSTIQFRTRNQYDPNIYQGTVSGTCTYGLAQKLNKDIAVYHLNVAKTVPDITDLADQDFFTLTTTVEENIPFAKEWVDPASIVLVSSTDYTDFRLYIIDDQIAVVRNLLTINNIRHRLL